MLDYNKAILLNANNMNYYLRRGELKIKVGEELSGCLDIKKYRELRVEPNPVENNCY